MTPLIHITLLLSIGLLQGCYNYHVNHSSRPDAIPLAAGAWPDRGADALREIYESTPGVITMFELDPDAEPHTNGAEPPSAPDVTVIANKLTAGGLARVYKSEVENSAFGKHIETLIYGFEPNGSYQSSRWFGRFGEATIDQAHSLADAFDKTLRSRNPGYRLARPTADELLLFNTHISLGVPTVPAGDRGILVHLPSLMGNDYELGVLDRLEADGWTILHIESDINIRGPGHEARVKAGAAREARAQQILDANPDIPSPTDRWQLQLDSEAMRWYREGVDAAEEQAALEIPLPETGFEIHPGDDLDAKARVIADAVNNHLADHAYAAQAGVDVLDELIPRLADKPIVVIGFSAGSLVTPTVAARLREVYPDRVGAMILVGSGAPIFDVSRYSKLTDGGLVITPPDGPAPDDATIDTLRDRYLTLATMDSWNTALVVRDLPVLHVYAAKDKIVPGFTARQLNERLGKPDRLVYSGGHLGLFYFIPPQRERIAKWLRDAIDRFEAKRARP